MSNPDFDTGPEPRGSAGESSPQQERHHVDVAASRAGRVWTAVAVGAIILTVLLIFVLQNTEETEIEFLGWHFTMPLGVSLLFAAIAGLLIMASAGGARIWQLRHAVKTANRP